MAPEDQAVNWIATTALLDEHEPIPGMNFPEDMDLVKVQAKLTAMDLSHLSTVLAKQGAELTITISNDSKRFVRTWVISNKFDVT